MQSESHRRRNFIRSSMSSRWARLFCVYIFLTRIQQQHMINSMWNSEIKHNRIKKKKKKCVPQWKKKRLNLDVRMREGEGRGKIREKKELGIEYLQFSGDFHDACLERWWWVYVCLVLIFRRNTVVVTVERHFRLTGSGCCVVSRPDIGEGGGERSRGWKGIDDIRLVDISISCSLLTSWLFPHRRKERD